MRQGINWALLEAKIYGANMQLWRKPLVLICIDFWRVVHRSPPMIPHFKQVDMFPMSVFCFVLFCFCFVFCFVCILCLEGFLAVQALCSSSPTSSVHSDSTYFIQFSMDSLLFFAAHLSLSLFGALSLSLPPSQKRQHLNTTKFIVPILYIVRCLNKLWKVLK